MTSPDPKMCCEAVRSAILATAWLLVDVFTVRVVCESRWPFLFHADAIADSYHTGLPVTPQWSYVRDSTLDWIVHWDEVVRVSARSLIVLHALQLVSSLCIPITHSNFWSRFKAEISRFYVKLLYLKYNNFTSTRQQQIITNFQLYKILWKALL